jgi:PAS domain S-box-containing protein
MSQTHKLKSRAPGLKSIQLSVETLLESYPDGAALIQPDGQVLAINSRMEKMIGPFRAGRCHEVLAGLSALCPFCPFEDLSSGKERVVKDQGTVRCGRTCNVNLHLLPDAADKEVILETVRYFADEEQCLELQKKDQEMMPRLLYKLSGLVSISRELIAAGPFRDRMMNVLEYTKASLSDPTGSIVWFEMGSKVYGTPPEDITGKLTVHEVEAEGISGGKLFMKCVTEGEIPAEDEYFLQETADLIARQVAVSELEGMLRQSEERYKKLAGNLKKEMWSRTQALAKETGHLEGILRSSEDMIITTDLEGRIVEFNPAAVKILGYAAEEIQGRPVSELWEDAGERDNLMDEVRESGGIRNYKTRLKAKTGEMREISLTLSLLKDPEGEILGTVGVSKDVSRENAIRRELERLNQNYRETIHFISHETKNSLIVIAGFVGRLLRTATDPDQKEKLEIIYHHAKFLEAMSKDFLVMSDVEHGEFHVRKEKIDDYYNDVILPAMMGIKERYPDSFESYDDSMGGVGGVSLMANRGLLETVYRNLFGNALKYRGKEGKIAYGAVDKGDRYLFNVWNAGPGVQADQVEKIFEKFYRVPDETTRDKRGTGLGLYNIRRIIQGHGGRIWCESEPGKWINFLFELPKE